MKGYALFVILMLMTLLLILTTSVSLNVKKEVDQTSLYLAEEKALSGADSGVQFALEAVRGKEVLPVSYSTAQWSSLQTQSGISVCFKVYAVNANCPLTQDVPLCPAGIQCIEADGEVVRGSSCDVTSLARILAARKVCGAIASSGVLTAWNEILP